MNNWLDNIEPKKVLKYFQEVSNIPRESGKEEQIADYLIEFAQKNGFEVVRDEYHNVLIRKEASPGKKDRPGVILQAHTDMVCEKNKGVVHDFSKDPIKLRIEGDKLNAEDTTLGADNGIGMAVALAILTDESVSHPPLEVLLTSDEERGMTGAENFDTRLLRGSVFINLDGSDEGIFIVGCAGGPGVLTEIPVERAPIDQQKGLAKLEVKGLKGGHSGEDIHRGRANAIKLLVQTILEIKKEIDVDLISVQGGLKYNAIPRESEAMLLISDKDLEKAMVITEKLEEALRKEYRASEPNLKIGISEWQEQVQTVSDPMSHQSTERILHYLSMAENGVLKMNPEFPELVESSVGMDVVRTEENRVLVETLTRSSYESAYHNSYQKIVQLAQFVGGSTSVLSDCPEWEYDPNSPITSHLISVYEKMTGHKASKQILHAGLECGVFGKKAGRKLDMVAIGPDIRDMHTPGEYVSLTSLERFWEFFKKAISEM